jgi:hypothetical protein
MDSDELRRLRSAVVQSLRVEIVAAGDWTVTVSTQYADSVNRKYLDVNKHNINVLCFMYGNDI